MKTTGDQILAEALKLFAREGYKAVTVERIAQEVGIRAPSLYKRFSGKRAIFEGIVRMMENADGELARENDMPEEAPAEEGYEDTSAEAVCSFTEAMFRHWTEEEFGGNFRRMLTLEQYRDSEMQRLYRQYLSEGPMKYMADVFRGNGAGEEEAQRLAMRFYAPVYYLYSEYDTAEDKSRVVEELKDHLNHFAMENQQYFGRSK